MPSLPLSRESKFSDMKKDINPLSWMSAYRQTSIGYLVMMVLFYHGIGIVVMLLGTLIVERVIIPGYEEPSRPIPLSIISVLSAGPIEETLFFGIPFYTLGNPFIVLAGGVLWATLHILNTDTLQINSLAFANWLFVIPSLFFSLRTWISGKGWFAIVSHSIWNLLFFNLACFIGEIPYSSSCRILSSETYTDELGANITSLVISAALVLFTYLLYKRKVDSEERKPLFSS